MIIHYSPDGKALVNNEYERSLAPWLLKRAEKEDQKVNL